MAVGIACANKFDELPVYCTVKPGQLYLLRRSLMKHSKARRLVPADRYYTAAGNGILIPV